MNTENGYGQLVTQLKQSLVRLSGQEGSLLTLKIDQQIKFKPGREPIQREDVHETQKVCLEDLIHVSIGDSTNVGQYVRLIFKNKMYATCGEKAAQVTHWVKTAAATNASSKIPKFPDVCFQQVVDDVKLVGEEVVFA